MTGSTFLELPEPWPHVAANLEVPSPDGSAFYRRDDAPAYVVAVHDDICTRLDAFLRDVPDMLASIAERHPDILEAERREPGHIGKLVCYAVNAWVSRSAPDLDLDALAATWRHAASHDEG